MRVLMLATYFPKPGNPLMGTWALEQAQALAKHPNITLTVVSLTSRLPSWLGLFSPGARAYADCPPKHLWDGLEVEYPRWLWYPVAPFKDWEYRRPQPFLRLAFASAARTLQRTIESFQPDVVFAHHSAVNGYVALRLRRRYGIPFVVTDHDFGEIQDCEQFPARRELFGQVSRESSCMVAVSRRMERIMKSVFFGAPTCTVHNGTLDVPRNAPPLAAANQPVVIFSCGAFYERKGFPLLVEAFAQVARRNPNVLLRIAGDGAQRAIAEAVAVREKVSDRVHFLGFLPHPDILREMAAADIFALVGWDEPFGVVFAEALAAGRPIVCANDCGITDVMESGVHGFSVPPRDAISAANAIETLTRDADLRRRMGEAGRTLYEHKLTWERNAQTMNDLFVKAIARSTPDHA